MPVPKEEEPGGHCVNRKPHTCKGDNRRNSSPCGSPIPSYSQAGGNDVYSYKKNSHFPSSCRSAFSAAVLRYVQEYRLRQEPDGLERLNPCGWKGLGTAAYKDGK